MSYPYDGHPCPYGCARPPDLLDTPRLLLKAVFAVMVHTRAEIEGKVWAEPRPIFPPPGCEPVVHHYRYSCLPPMPGRDCTFT